MSTARKTGFELTGADGGPLRGEVCTAADGRGRPAVVLCHGFKGSKDRGFFPQLAERIARAGLTAVKFNFSGSGVGSCGQGFDEPERFARSTFSNDVRDIATVCNALLRGELVEGLPRSDSYGLFGYSRGGGTAVLHAASNTAVAGLVTWAAISHVDRWDAETIAEWRSTGRREPLGDDDEEGLAYLTNMIDDIEQNADSLDITAAAGQVVAPWLIIHGRSDDFVPVSEGERLHRAAQKTSASFRVFEAGNHTFTSDGQLDSALDLTVGWFSKHLF